MTAITDLDIDFRTVTPLARYGASWLDNMAKANIVIIRKSTDPDGDHTFDCMSAGAFAAYEAGLWCRYYAIEEQQLTLQTHFDYHLNAGRIDCVDYGNGYVEEFKVIPLKDTFLFDWGSSRTAIELNRKLTCLQNGDPKRIDLFRAINTISLVPPTSEYLRFHLVDTNNKTLAKITLVDDPVNEKGC